MIGWILTVLILLVITGWETLAVYYSNLPEPLRLPGAIGIALVSLGALLMVRPAGRSILFFLSIFAIVVLGFLLIPPSNDRDWQPDVARLSWADIDGDRITVHNIRNFEYRSETDYTPAYYDKRFDLSKLEAVDVVAVYWMGPTIAHVLLSFGFTGGDHLAISIEARKKKGEGYSTLKGFFRQYELYYVVADERDVIRLRTNYRHDPPEDVYVYRARHGTLESGRRLFLEYMVKINNLKASPEFYNTLTTNCTTNIWMNTRVNPEHLPFNWKILASGYVPEYLYESGRLDNSMPFAELTRRSHVNARAHAADTATDFSQRIRTGK
ncbi:MAG: DUF4105 domain-containing protein [Pseudomonadota bacterium]